MMNDGMPQETRDFFLREDLSILIQCLNCNGFQEYADLLLEVQNKKPKICVVKTWPDEIIINGLDIMVLINGMMLSLGCEIVVE
jgi:hypothetical protein